MKNRSCHQKILTSLHSQPHNSATQPEFHQEINTTIGAKLRHQGISRRSFLKFCAATTSLLALPPSMVTCIADALDGAPRQSVLWLSFQECTGCTESFIRADTSSIDELIFDYISLDYHHILQAAAGEAAEQALASAQQTHAGKYILIVEGAIPLANPGYSTVAGISNLATLKHLAADAKAILAVGTCASFGGIPHAVPNPTGAVGVADLITNKPIVNIPGCPPIPTVITSVIVHLLTFGEVPELDELNRPIAFFGNSIHSHCYRRPFFSQELFAERFDDEGAKQGYCLFNLGCKGIATYNACATAKWNEQTSFPIQSGHGCLGCAEPFFWDKGSFYRALFTTTNATTLPNLGKAGAIDKDGHSLTTDTTFAGGLAIKEGEGKFQPTLTFRQSKMVEIRGNITVESTHIGQTADILLVVVYQPLLSTNTLPLYFMLDMTGNALIWNGNLAELVPFQQTTLTTLQEIPIYQGKLLTPGIFKLYFGYRLLNGAIVSNIQSIDMTITE
jgi:hydrogenase small subunit